MQSSGSAFQPTQDPALQIQNAVSMTNAQSLLAMIKCGKSQGQWDSKRLIPKPSAERKTTLLANAAVHKNNRKKPTASRCHQVPSRSKQNFITVEFTQVLDNRNLLVRVLLVLHFYHIAAKSAKQTQVLFAGANNGIINFKSLVLPSSRGIERLPNIELETTLTFYQVLPSQLFVGFLDSFANQQLSQVRPDGKILGSRWGHTDQAQMPNIFLFSLLLMHR